jgi:uncharacterized membrane protein
MTMTPLSKRLIIALVVSVAVNLLIGGIFAGAAINRSRLRAERAHAMLGARGPGPREGRPHDDGPRGEPGEERGRREGRGPRRGGPFSGLLAGHREEMHARREATVKVRAGVVEALRHEPFDPAALERSLGALRSETATTQELLHKTILDTARSGDAEARAKLARGFERMDEGPP